MNDNDKDDGEALKKALVRRIAVAGLAIVALLGALAVLENFMSGEPEPSPPAAASVPAFAAAHYASPPAVAAPPVDKPATEAADVAAAPAEPESTALPVALARPEEEEAPAQASASPAEHDKGKTGTLSVSAATIEERAHGPASGYLLQVGVFQEVSNAQDLHGKLAHAGMPARIEARVQVGPFKTRREAAAARARLRELGLRQAVLLPAHAR